jgi:hypothetical protein
MDGKRSIVIDVTLDWRALLAVVALVGIGAATVLTAGAQGPLTANGDVATMDGAAAGGEPAAAPRSTSRTAQGFVTLRSFYLTDGNYSADEALGVCAEGYHMASLWEILNVSNLAYAYDQPDAHTKSDSGEGPPSNWYGWARTGGASSGVDTAGIGNCRAWTSTDASEDGSIARLHDDWTTASSVVGPWDTDTFGCSGFAPVWCIED